MKKLIFTFLLLFTVFSFLFSQPVFAVCTNAGAGSECSSDSQCKLVGITGKENGVCDQVTATLCQCSYPQQLPPGGGQSLPPGEGVILPPGGGVTLPPGEGQCTSIFGCITNPLPVDPTNKAPGGGLISLLNNILRLIFVASGIYAFVRVVLAGLKFMSAGGDSKAIEAAWNSIWQSILGVVIIISSLALAALMGLVLFGDATAILQPVIFGPVTP